MSPFLSSDVRSEVIRPTEGNSHEAEHGAGARPGGRLRTPGGDRRVGVAPHGRHGGVLLLLLELREEEPELRIGDAPTRHPSGRPARRPALLRRTPGRLAPR